ncbi:hypothetical protein ACPCVO_48995 [Streptomyces umbrinus]|uniref:hypothetical protein n=1 Tax=Streptomyces umbrinus TaxID=67370 RepID=UPI003C2EB3DD
MPLSGRAIVFTGSPLNHLVVQALAPDDLALAVVVVVTQPRSKCSGQPAYGSCPASCPQTERPTR